jgi:hypothetical protein
MTALKNFKMGNTYQICLWQIISEEFEDDDYDENDFDDEYDENWDEEEY